LDNKIFVSINAWCNHGKKERKKKAVELLLFASRKRGGKRMDSFLTSAPDEGEWLVSGSGLINTKISASRTQ